MSLFLKKLLAPFCYCYKGYQILYSIMQKGMRYHLQNPKNPRKINVYCMPCSITLWQFDDGAQITFGAVAKVICYPLDYFACGIHKLLATQIMFCDTTEST
jgi:hypothetical protein